MMTEVTVTDDVETCLAIRRTVFIEEQGVPEAEEVDGLDGDAIQLLAHQGGQVIGTARILMFPTYGKIGRVAVLQEARGSGAGVALIKAATSEIRSRGAAQAKLGAQTNAIGFYERLGFVVEGPEYMDAGIPHRDMVATL